MLTSARYSLNITYRVVEGSNVVKIKASNKRRCYYGFQQTY
jgi:hypothetical protein